MALLPDPPVAFTRPSPMTVIEPAESQSEPPAPPPEPYDA